jgi:hypothetical protein
MTRSRGRLTRETVRRLTLATDPWLSCDECFEKLDTFVELLLASAAPPPPPAMRAHLRGCAACEEEARSLLLLVAGDRGIDAGPALRSLTAH